MSEKRVTIDDVAHAAGVSRQTVSRAINDLSGISPVTRSYILQLAQKMGYRPSGIARGLANAHQLTHTLGVVVPTIDNEFYAAVLHGIEDLASELGYNVFLCDTNEDPQQEYRKIQSLLGLWVDGIIICASRMEDAQIEEIAEQIRPLVLLNREFQHPHVGNVLIDDHAGSYQAVRHLIDQGHRKIGMLMGIPASRSSYNRQQGYMAAMQEAGLPVQADWWVHTEAAIDQAYETARDFLRQHPNLTALLVYNDVRAAAVLRACAELQIAVPRQLALVSHDNISLSALLIPSLSTVDIPKYQMGQEGLLMLIEMLKDKELCPPTVSLSPSLIIRESSRPNGKDIK